METPVEIGDLHRLLGVKVCSAVRLRAAKHSATPARPHRRTAVRYRIRGTVMRRTRIGSPYLPCVIRPELGIAPAAEGHTDDEDQKQCYGKHVEPAEAGGDIGQSVGTPHQPVLDY